MFLGCFDKLRKLVRRFLAFRFSENPATSKSKVIIVIQVRNHSRGQWTSRHQSTRKIHTLRTGKRSASQNQETGPKKRLGLNGHESTIRLRNQTEKRTGLNRQSNQKIIQNRWEQSTRNKEIIQWQDTGWEIGLESKHVWWSKQKHPSVLVLESKKNLRKKRRRRRKGYYMTL